MTDDRLSNRAQNDWISGRRSTAWTHRADAISFFFLKLFSVTVRVPAQHLDNNSCVTGAHWRHVNIWEGRRCCDTVESAWLRGIEGFHPAQMGELSSLWKRLCWDAQGSDTAEVAALLVNYNWDTKPPWTSGFPCVPRVCFVKAFSWEDFFVPWCWAGMHFLGLVLLQRTMETSEGIGHALW